MIIIEILKRNGHALYFFIIHVQCMCLYNIPYLIFLYFFNRCSVFLIDKETKELVAEVFDGISTNNKEVPLKLFVYFSPNQLRTVKPN